ncbi:hypothetical protein LSTR_LSTR012034 [Laodelphax striatellus]|uniref:Uncharacterized protein n=1 Tax=Laodelphax striatellus TaxID=195883 RepID=A0A482XNI2_LAOST|nr:hypothetical protein LSTR_LSTR012034 [Laodelphax striatellus]
MYNRLKILFMLHSILQASATRTVDDITPAAFVGQLNTELSDLRGCRSSQTGYLQQCLCQSVDAIIGAYFQGNLETPTLLYLEHLFSWTSFGSKRFQPVFSAKTATIVLRTSTEFNLNL